MKTTKSLFSELVCDFQSERCARNASIPSWSVLSLAAIPPAVTLLSRDRLEVGMESRDAHANLSRDVFDAQWLGEILTQFLDGSDDAMSVSSNRGEMAHAMTLFADQQAIDNFPNNQRTKYPILFGHLKQPYQAQAGIEQIRIKRADGNGLDAAVILAMHETTIVEVTTEGSRIRGSPT